MYVLTVLWGIKTREGRSKNFHKIPGIPEVHVHVFEVGVNMITIPDTELTDHITLSYFMQHIDASPKATTDDADYGKVP